MAWAAEEGLSLNWTFYLWVDVWRRRSFFAGLLLPEIAVAVRLWSCLARAAPPGA